MIPLHVVYCRTLIKAQLPKHPHTQSVTCLAAPPIVNSPFHASAVWKNFYICLQKSALCLDNRARVHQRESTLFSFLSSSFSYSRPISCAGTHTLSFPSHLLTCKCTLSTEKFTRNFFFFLRVLACCSCTSPGEEGKKAAKGEGGTTTFNWDDGLVFFFLFF